MYKQVVGFLLIGLSLCLAKRSHHHKKHNIIKNVTVANPGKEKSIISKKPKTESNTLTNATGKSVIYKKQNLGMPLNNNDDQGLGGEPVGLHDADVSARPFHDQQGGDYIEGEHGENAMNGHPNFLPNANNGDAMNMMGHGGMNNFMNNGGEEGDHGGNFMDHEGDGNSYRGPKKDPLGADIRPFNDEFKEMNGGPENHMMGNPQGGPPHGISFMSPMHNESDDRDYSNPSNGDEIVNGNMASIHGGDNEMGKPGHAEFNGGNFMGPNSDENSFSGPKKDPLGPDNKSFSEGRRIDDIGDKGDRAGKPPGHAEFNGANFMGPNSDENSFGGPKKDPLGPDSKSFNEGRRIDDIGDRGDPAGKSGHGDFNGGNFMGPNSDDNCFNCPKKDQLGGEMRPFNSGEMKPFNGGEMKPFNGGEMKPFNDERKNDDVGDRGDSAGEQLPMHGKSGHGEFTGGNFMGPSSDEDSFRGPKKDPLGADIKPFNDEHRSDDMSEEEEQAVDHPMKFMGHKEKGGFSKQKENNEHTGSQGGESDLSNPSPSDIGKALNGNLAALDSVNIQGDSDVAEMVRKATHQKEFHSKDSGPFNGMSLLEPGYSSTNKQFMGPAGLPFRRTKKGSHSKRAHAKSKVARGKVSKVKKTKQ